MDVLLCFLTVLYVPATMLRYVVRSESHTTPSDPFPIPDTRGLTKLTLSAFIVSAASYGQLETLQWLHQHGCPWCEETCAAAAYRGHFHILKWARTHGCPWNGLTCSAAAHFGDLRALQWARANGCPWNAETFSGAARGGHMHVLTWLKQNNCPWDERTSNWAAIYGHLEVLKWLNANDCPYVSGVSRIVHERFCRPSLNALLVMYAVPYTTFRNIYQSGNCYKYITNALWRPDYSPSALCPARLLGPQSPMQ
jgi:hypothetical protein